MFNSHANWQPHSVSRVDIVHAAYSRVQTMVWQPLLGIFMAHTDVTARDRTQRLCKHHTRICPESELWVKKKNPCCSRELKQYTKLNTLPTKLHLCSIQVSLHTERTCLRKGDRPDQLSYIPAPYWFYYRLKDFTQGKCQTWCSTRWAASLPCTNFITYKECVPETRARPSAQQDEQHPCPIQVLLYTDR